MKKINSLILLSFLILIFSSCSKKEDETSNIYIINNADFGISSNKTNAKATNAGINAALKKAKQEGYNHIKLTPGEYLIHADGSVGGFATLSGIFVPSNITLDLTGCKLYIEPNSYLAYKILRLHMSENITIIGGHLFGDRDVHEYVGYPEKTHEAGAGIDMVCCKNITIKNMKFQDMTGDAIGIGYGYIAPGERRSNKNIKILNCEMFSCRRQGISIIHGKDIEIAYNKFHHIGGTTMTTGTDPGSAIDLEPEGERNSDGSMRWNSSVDDVNIHHNEFSTTHGYDVCIVNRFTTDVEVADNYFDNATIVMNRNPARIRIVRNTMIGWNSYISAPTVSIDVYMPDKGPNMNNVESKRLKNCSQMTGYITETDNYISTNCQ